MGRTGITYHEVANAIATIQGKQKNPTVDAIREELGTGSRTTIAKYFLEWKTKNGARNTTETGIPTELQNLIQSLWEKIQSDADRKIEAHQVEADEEIGNVKNQLSQIQHQNTLLHTDIKTLSEKHDHQTQISETLKNTLNNLENEKAKLLERVSSLESHNVDHKNENDRLHLLLKNTQNNLVHYQQKIEEQRQEQMLLIEKQRNDYELKLSQYQNQMALLSQEKNKIDMQHDQIQKSYEKLIGEKQQLKKQHHDLEMDHQKLTMTHHQLQLSNHELKIQFDAKESEIKTKDQAMSEMKISCGISENKIAMLENQSKYAEHQYKMLLSEKNKLYAKLSFIQKTEKV